MKHIPFLDIKSQHNEIETQLTDAFHRVLANGIFIQGEELKDFETEFANFCHVKHCIGVANGLEAIHLLLKAYGIGSGDEVIVPSNTFIATWLAVSECQAIPVAVEPCLDTYNIDPDKIRAVITSKTKAIIAVHLYGQPADMDPINAIAKEFGLVVLEDAAQAQGAKYKGRAVGGLGHAAATSFYPGKNLGCLGDGGAVLTDDVEIANKVKELRNYGSPVKYVHNEKGYNSRLDELQAAFLREKLKKLPVWNDSRKKIAQLYHEKLSNSSVVIPFVPQWVDPVWHLYVIRSTERNRLKDYLEKNGVMTIIHYPIPPHVQKCYLEYQHVALPLAQKISDEVLSLPFFPHMKIDEVEYVAKLISAF